MEKSFDIKTIWKKCFDKMQTYLYFNSKLHVKNKQKLLELLGTVGPSLT